MPENSEILFLLHNPVYSGFCRACRFRNSSFAVRLCTFGFLHPIIFPPSRDCHTVSIDPKEFHLEYFSSKLKQISKFQVLILRKKVTMFIWYRLIKVQCVRMSCSITHNIPPRRNPITLDHHRYWLLESHFPSRIREGDGQGRVRSGAEPGCHHFSKHFYPHVPEEANTMGWHFACLLF